LELLLGSRSEPGKALESSGHRSRRDREPDEHTVGPQFPVTLVESHGLSSAKGLSFRKRMARESSAPVRPASFGGLSGTSPVLGHSGVATHSGIRGATKKSLSRPVPRRSFAYHFTRGQFSCSCLACGRPPTAEMRTSGCLGSVLSQGLCAAGGVLDLDTSRRSRAVLGLRVAVTKDPPSTHQMSV